MTQVEFAAALKVAPTSIHRWEAGTGSPEFEMVVALWSLAIERGSSTSTDFSEFLMSRSDAIRPLLHAKELPDIEALDQEIAMLPVDQRELTFAFVQMLKMNRDEVTDKIMRLILAPWKQSLSSVEHVPRSARKFRRLTRPKI